MHARALWRLGALLGFAVALIASPLRAQQADPLPSWNDGPTKQAILDFVRATTNPGSPDFVAPTGSLPSTKTGRCGSSTRSTARWCSRSTGWWR